MDIQYLLQQMTLEEKIGQLLQLPPHNFIKTTTDDIAGHIYDLGLTQSEVFLAGSVLGIRNAEESMKVQKAYLEKSRLQIPLLIMADVIHGYETIFPIPLALACSWNDDLAYNMARTAGKEAAAAGIHVTFAPMADLSRDPRWGRIMEGLGEDSYLLSRFTKAMVEGFQTESLRNPGTVASCVKHYAAYGATEAGRDYNTVDMSKLSLYGQYIKGYQTAVDAGARMVMASFNTFDGVPMHINKEMMVEILRDELGFNGVTVTDYDGLNQVIAHGAAEDQKDAAFKGIRAKIDIEMASSCYTKHIATLLEENLLQESQIDEAVLRILALKDELGLFDNPYRFADPDLEESLVLSQEHLDAAKEAALESAVLLKNDGALPLSKQDHIAFMGPFANTPKTNGAWSWHGNVAENRSLYQASKEWNPNVVLVDSIEELNATNIKTVIYVFGEKEHDSGEAKSKVSLRLPQADVQTIHTLKEQGYTVISVLYNGRPFILTNIQESNAIVEAWYLGTQSSDALSDLLFGEENFSGKLTVSFPRHEGQIPLYYNHLSTGRPYFEKDRNPYTSFYLDESNEPLYYFGYGLSYSNFTYNNLVVSKDILHDKDELRVTVDVSNTSDIPGLETIQLYIHDVKADIARPVQELVGYQKVYFDAKETKTVTFTLETKDFMYTTSKNTLALENGAIKIMVGPSSNNVLETTIQFQRKEN